jgi:tetratricopeptide (TPR) repeat protein
LRAKGDYARAQSLFEQLLDTAAKRGNAQEIALAQEGIGQVLFRQERYREAFRRFEESHRQSRLAKATPGVGFASLSMARIALVLGKPDEARRLLAEARDTAESAGLKGLHAFTELRLGEVEIAEGRAAAALKRIDAARALLGGADPEDNIEAGLPGMAALSQLGRGTDAVRECENVLPLAKSLGDPWHQGRVDLACAAVYLGTGARSRASELATRALRGFEAAGQPQLEWRARVVLARLEPRDGEARARARDSLRRLEQIMGSDFATYRQRRDVRADWAWLQ